MKHSIALVGFVLGAALSLPASLMGGDSTWNFDDPLDRFANSGPGVSILDYFDPTGSGWGPLRTSFGSASSFGVSAMLDGDPQVMRFPACTPQEGYTITHDGVPNGVFEDSGLVSNYTIIMDVLYPSLSDGQWRALYQADPGNQGDAELYVENASDGGVGIAGRYSGEVTPGEWHRLAVVVRSAPGEGQLHKYINGTFVGGQGTTGSAIDAPWALGSLLHLFTDGSGATAAGFVSSIRFIDRNLSMEEVEALGRPTVAGAGIAGPPPGPYPYELPRRVDIIGHRGESCCYPENTLIALEKAFMEGATWCEVDIRMTADGVAVLMHDADVARTTDGTGAVSGLTVAQLQTLDAGSWFGSGFVGETPPTLQEAYQLARSMGGKLYLDLKVTGMGNALLAALTGAQVPIEDTWFWVYSNPAEAAALRAIMPGAKIIWGEPAASWRTDPDYWDDMRAMGVFGFDLGSGTGEIDSEFVLAARAEGFYISNYTLLDPESFIRSVTNGAMGIEIDFVEIAERMMPPYDIEYFTPAPITDETPLGSAQLNAVAGIAGSFEYAPPAGTLLPVGTHVLTATFTPADLGQFPIRSVEVAINVTSGNPPTFQLDKTVYGFGEEIVVSWEDSPGNTLDWIGIYPPGIEPGSVASTTWLYVSGSQTAGGSFINGSVTFSGDDLPPPGDWVAHFLANDGYEGLAPPVLFTIGDSELLSFRAASYAFAPGEQVRLFWEFSSDVSLLDSLTIDDGSGQVSVQGQNSVLVSPAGGPTVYELAANGVVVGTVALFPETGGTSVLALDQRFYGIGESLVASFESGPGDSTDWIGIYPLGIVPDGSPASTRWFYVNGTQTAGAGISDGTVTFDLAGQPLPAGDYLAFFLASDGYNLITEPVYFNVSAEPPAEPALAFQSILVEEGEVVLTWSSQPGKSYKLEYSSGLQSWIEDVDGIESEGEVTSVRVTGAAAAGARHYYRVSEEE